jgi:transposase
MRLTSIVPHEHYRNLEERRFTCAACGGTFADAVAQVD